MTSLAWFLPLLLVATTVSAIKPCEIRRAEMLELIRENPGIVGVHVPVCDESGGFAAIQCRGSVCYCTSESGGQLMNYKFVISKRGDTLCKCAREEYHLHNIIGKRVACDGLGNYKSRQCTGSVCYCTDAKEGIHIGESVPISKLSELNC